MNRVTVATSRTRRQWAGSTLPVAVLVTVVLCPWLVQAVQSDAAATGAKPCGSYYESGLYGEYTGNQNKRVSVWNQSVACGPAITIVREFRSFLPKRHHGKGGDAGSWTLPADPGWSCRREGSEGTCNRGRAVARFRVNVLSSRARCASSGSDAGAIYVSWRHVGCKFRHRIGRSLLHGHRRQNVGGFRCRNLALRAGGGGALCRRGASFLEVGFE